MADGRANAGSLSESVAIFDPAPLEAIAAELGHRISSRRGESLPPHPLRGADGDAGAPVPREHSRSRRVARAGAGELCLHRRTQEHAGGRNGKVRRRRACHRPADYWRRPRCVRNNRVIGTAESARRSPSSACPRYRRVAWTCRTSPRRCPCSAPGRPFCRPFRHHPPPVGRSNC